MFHRPFGCFFLWEYQSKNMNQCTPLIIKNKETHREIDKTG